MQPKSKFQQLSFSFGRSPEALHTFREQELRKPLSLVITSNSTIMLSYKKQEAGLQVRLHGLFLHASDAVLAEIVSFLRNGRRRPMPLFRQHVRENRERIVSKPPKRTSLRTSGRWHDLRTLFEEVNREYFSGSINAGITWGSRSPRTAVRKRTLGSFSERLSLIRINPMLDRKSVPRYYIAFVVYHEMLHAALGIDRAGGRRCIHSREFRKREKLYQDYERAIAWEKGNV